MTIKNYSLKASLTFLLFSVLATSLFAQNKTQQFQSVFGIVLDKETQQPIVEAEIVLGLGKSATSNEEISLKTKTDAKGKFAFEEVPIGRINISASAKGYQLFAQGGYMLSSGKEASLQIEMDQEIERVAEVNITRRGGHQTNNDAALVSARLFTVDETDRFAGSRGDPARMASNFAGVQGADDSRNDIVVRGNSPSGILWRMEGIDIPNPNHFAIPGTTGGSVSIINNKILGNSDFFTGAFPAEYGNSIAGAFDLKLRAGNTRKLEVSSQLGILGWDVLAEGPLNRIKGSSFLVTYRYSTLSMFNALKIPIGTDAIPNYQDASFHLKFPLKKNASLSFFGIGGKSNIDIIISKDSISSRNLYGDNDRDQYFGSRMYVLGSSYTKPLSKKSYFKAVFSYNHQVVNAYHELVYRTIIDSFIKDGELFHIFRNDDTVPNLDYTFKIQSIGTHLFVNNSVSPQLSWKYGVQFRHFIYTFQDSNLNINPLLSNYWTWSTRWNAAGNANLIMPYIQFKYKFNKQLLMVAGIQSQIFGINYTPLQDLPGTKAESHLNAAWFLPRFSLQYRMDQKNSFNFGTGIHAQTQSEYMYFFNRPGEPQPHNLGMDMTKSAHFVLGWDYNIKRGSRIKMETYYQNLWNIPVEVMPSSFSLANTGSGFSRFFPNKLENKGVGYNYGYELTVERFFSKGFYYLFSGSVFDAKYQGSDGVWRSSDFNTNYAVNALFAKEFTFSNKNILNIGGKATFAGARRYSPFDTAASIAAREYIELDAKKNSERFDKPYMRFDVRISYRINGKGISHEIAFDFINVTNRKNILNYTFINEPPFRRENYQLGFLPLFYYKIEF